MKTSFFLSNYTLASKKGCAMVKHNRRHFYKVLVGSLVYNLMRSRAHALSDSSYVYKYTPNNEHKT